MLPSSDDEEDEDEATSDLEIEALPVPNAGGGGGDGGGNGGLLSAETAQSAVRSLCDVAGLLLEYLENAAEATKTGAVAHRWTPQEEAQLSALVEELGPRGKWGQIAEKLASGRTSSGVEQHWKIMHGAHHGAKKARLAPAAPPTSRAWSTSKDARPTKTSTSTPVSTAAISLSPAAPSPLAAPWT